VLDEVRQQSSSSDRPGIHDQPQLGTVLRLAVGGRNTRDRSSMPVVIAASNGRAEIDCRGGAAFFASSFGID
jgi:hypothetical protein